MKVLVVRFSSIGDIVLTSPVVRGLSEQVGAEVHYLTKTRFAELVTSIPFISKVHAISRSVSEVSDELRAERYDAIIDLHVNLRSLQVRWLLFGVRTYAFHKLNVRKWVLTNLKIDVLPRVHIVDRYLAAAEGLGVYSDGKGLDFRIPQEAQLNVQQKWPELSDSRGFVAFSIGATHATKRLPTEKIEAVCRMLPVPVVLLGGDDMAEAGQQLERTVGSRVVNACGRLSLFQSASVIDQASVVLTHDTGLMHIAAALKKPIVSVWGNTVPAFGMTPYLPDDNIPSAIMEVAGLSCRPCSKIGHARCPRGHFRCMREQDESIIASTVMQCLGQTEN